MRSVSFGKAPMAQQALPGWQSRQRWLPRCRLPRRSRRRRLQRWRPRRQMLRPTVPLRCSQQDSCLELPKFVLHCSILFSLAKSHRTIAIQWSNDRLWHQGQGPQRRPKAAQRSTEAAVGSLQWTTKSLDHQGGPSHGQVRFLISNQ